VGYPLVPVGAKGFIEHPQNAPPHDQIFRVFIEHPQSAPGTKCLGWTTLSSHRDQRVLLSIIKVPPMIKCLGVGYPLVTVGPKGFIEYPQSAPYTSPL
jgi:hypothetical protein